MGESSVRKHSNMKKNRTLSSYADIILENKSIIKESVTLSLTQKVMTVMWIVIIYQEEFLGLDQGKSRIYNLKSYLVLGHDEP